MQLMYVDLKSFQTAGVKTPDGCACTLQAELLALLHKESDEGLVAHTGRESSNDFEGTSCAVTVESNVRVAEKRLRRVRWL